MKKSEIRSLKKLRDGHKNAIAHWRDMFDRYESGPIRQHAFLMEAKARAEIEKINQALGRHA